MQRLSIFAVVILLGCGGGETVDAGVDITDAGALCTAQRWSPESGSIDRWPEPALLVDDPTTETGRRLRMTLEEYPVLAATLRGYRPVFTDDLAELDGFGINAESFFRFNRAWQIDALPSGEATMAADAGLGLLVLSPGEPRLHPVLVESADEDSTILLAPLRPLPAHAEVAAFVTTNLAGPAGGCLEQSAVVAADLASPDARTLAAVDALVTLGVIASSDDLAAITAFPTQSIEEDTIAVSQDIAAREAPGFVSPPTCETGSAWIRCDARFVAQDYRDADGVFRRARDEAATPTASYEVPVTIWLPLTGPGPYPTILYGHGLGGARDQARRVADLAAPRGFATVSAPALEHGEHPTHEDPNAESLAVVLDFFAIGDLTSRALHATRLRENFRQTTWDRLQLTRLLGSGVDVNGDGSADLDPDRLLYLGISLGGLMGPELLAATDDYGAGVLVVPGGRVSTIMYRSEIFGSLVELLRPRTATEGDVRRFFPVLQTVLDAGDPASYAPHGLQDRFATAPDVPSVLVAVVLDDEVVPNVANYAVGRAFGVPIIEPLLRPEPGFVTMSGPVMGNFAEGRATGGLLQFDWIERRGEVVAADHGNVGDSEVGLEAWFDFLQTHLDTGIARIRDPYMATGFARP